MNKNMFPESREELISMFLGLGVVVVAVVIIFNFIMRTKGNVSLSGVSTKNQQVLTTPGATKTNEVGSNNTYEVKRGDTLWSVAMAKYGNGFLWTKIANANNLKQPYSIEVGQKLTMPVVTEAEIKAVPKTTAPMALTYTVKRGDSLWKIATVKSGSGYRWVQLWSLNKAKIGNPDKLEIGMVLRLK